MSEARRARPRRVWTENELDSALRALGGEPRVNERALALARARLAAALAAAPAVEPHPQPREGSAIMHRLDQHELSGELAGGGAEPRARRGRRWALAAAAAALAAGALLLQTVPFDHRQPVATASAREVLDRAARLQVAAADPPLAAGQYRHVTTHAWWTVDNPMLGLRYLAEHVIEAWIPADPRGEWGLRRTITGRRQWQLGGGARADRTAPLPGAGWQQGSWRAKGGRFSMVSPKERVKLSRLSPAERARILADRARPLPPSWQNPTPAWLDRLPTAPPALLQRLLADVGDGGGKWRDGAALRARALDAAADALRSGLVPADVRARIYQALAGLPGLKIAERQANLDGVEGIALGVDDGAVRHDIIIGGGNGQFIGERTVLTRPTAGVPAGTVTEFTAVTTEVVDAIPSDV